ncbi:MAG: acylphosphatase [Candidatus Eremiobacterota bacterium]
MAECVWFRVTGWVQGVGFRAYTRDHARHLGLTGWVCNMPDGSVEALVEGDPALLERLLEVVRRGPPGSRVTDLEVRRGPATGSFDGFKVRFEGGYYA